MSIGQIKDYTPNFSLIIPRFDIATWHDYMENNFRSIDALFYNLFGINQYKGEWQNSTTYQVGDVLFIGDPNSQYNGRLIKVLIAHTTTANDSFDTYYTNNPNNYDLFVDAASAEQAAQISRDWAIKTDGKVQGIDYSSKYYANLVTPISSNIITVSEIANDVSTVASISSNVTSVDNNSANITTVANNINSVNANATYISDINTNATNISAINTTSTNISDINTAANNIVAIQNASTNATNAANSASLAQDWATKMNGLVDNTDYSAKYYADQAATTFSSKQDKLTVGTGIDITNNVISVKDKVLLNRGDSYYRSSLGILGSISDSTSNAVWVGYGSDAYNNATSLGFQARANNINSIAIGYNAVASANYAIQIGSGTNSEAHSIYFATSLANNYKMLDYRGLIPAERHASVSLTAGDYYAKITVDGQGNITQSWSAISGGGSSYTAGTGIDITNNTISIDNTVVTTNTTQTITGAKIFAGIGWIIEIQNTNVTYNTAPSEDIGTTIIYTDANNNAMGAVECWRTTDNSTVLQLNVRGANGNWGTHPLQLRVDANGNTNAYAPTPPAGSNGTDISTTEWVHSAAPNLAMPNYSTKFGLTLPASGGTIQAPYDGYIVIVINATAGSYLSVGSNYYQAGPNNGYIGGMLPIRKGDNVYVFYSGLIDVVQCEFRPCVGAL